MKTRSNTKFNYGELAMKHAKPLFIIGSVIAATLAAGSAQGQTVKAGDVVTVKAPISTSRVSADKAGGKVQFAFSHWACQADKLQDVYSKITAASGNNKNEKAMVLGCGKAHHRGAEFTRCVASGGKSSSPISTSYLLADIPGSASRDHCYTWDELQRVRTAFMKVAKS